MKRAYKKIKCPLCSGTGIYNKRVNPNFKIIPRLRKKGLTYREIMKAVGFKSLDSVHYYLKRGRKAGKWKSKIK